MRPRLVCYGYRALLLEGPRRIIPGAYRGAGTSAPRPGALGLQKCGVYPV